MPRWSNLKCCKQHRTWSSNKINPCHKLYKPSKRPTHWYESPTWGSPASGRPVCGHGGRAFQAPTHLWSHQSSSGLQTAAGNAPPPGSFPLRPSWPLLNPDLSQKNTTSEILYIIHALQICLRWSDYVSQLTWDCIWGKLYRNARMQLFLHQQEHRLKILVWYDVKRYNQP